MKKLYLSVLVALSVHSAYASQKKSSHEAIDLESIRLGEIEDGFCIPCNGGIKPLSDAEEKNLLKQVQEWTINRDNKKPTHLVRDYNFPNFPETLRFINQVAAVAEREKHHPDIYLSYTNVRLELHTHAIKGLSLNDFVLAAKINKLKPILTHKKMERPTSTIRTHRVKQSQIQDNVTQLMKWKVKSSPYPQLTRETIWKNFNQAMQFVNHLGTYMQEVKYYPEIYIFYNKVNLELYEHPTSKSLEGPDFIVARSVNLIIDKVWQKFHTRALEPKYKILKPQ